MALPVTSNIASLNAQRNLQKNTLAMNKSLERLSSGMRINRAGDDAAGLAISEGLRSQIRGLNQAVRNANDGLSLIGTAESAVSSYTDILQRIRELAVQSANDTNSAVNRQAINGEAGQLLSELQRISTTVEFNGTSLLDGTFNNKQIQVGSEAHQSLSLTLGNMQTNKIGMVVQQTSAVLPATNALGAGDLLFNGIDVAPSLPDGVSSTNSSASAIAIAKAINEKTAETGVTAKAEATVMTSAAAVGGATLTPPAQQLTINGVNIIDSTLVVSSNDSSSSLRNAINARTNQTGVTASIDNTGKLMLTAADGRNITATTTGGIAAAVGLAGSGDFDNTTTPAGGTISLTSNNDIVVSGNNPGRAGLATTTYVKDPNTALNNLTLATAAGSTAAISMLDNALTQVNGMRSQLGAVTNRLEQTVQNLQAISENLSASDSRIRDADFATETANMTRNQILQNAGISILAQANQSPQAALKLLQQ